MKIQTVLTILACAVSLNGTENVTIQELGQSDYQALQKAQSDEETALKEYHDAEKRYDKASEQSTSLARAIEQRFGDNSAEQCKAGESRHLTRAEVRGKYVIITDTEDDCKTIMHGGPVTSWGVGIYPVSQ